MPGSDDYPRQSVHALRQARRARAESALAQAAKALQAARAELQLAEAEVERERTTPRAVVEETGTATAISLQREAAFAERQTRLLQRLRAQRAQAEVAVAACEAAQLAAQQTLTEALADEQVLERDRDRYDVQQRNAKTRAEVSETEDQHEARHHGRGRA